MGEKLFLLLILLLFVLTLAGIVIMYVKLGILKATLLLAVVVALTALLLYLMTRNAPTEEELLSGEYSRKMKEKKEAKQKKKAE